MSLLDLRKAIVGQLKNALPADVKVQSHPGRFDLEELRNTATGAPAVLVAITGVASVSEDVAIVADCQLAAFVVTRSDRAHRADERALALATALVQLINGNAFGVDQASSARDVRWQNLYGNEENRQGVHLSAVTWRQPLQLVQDIADLPDFEQLVARYDLGPDPDGRIEAEDHIPLQQEEP